LHFWLPRTQHRAQIRRNKIESQGTAQLKWGWAAAVAEKFSYKIRRD
jgi:hypothetical protein